MLHLVALLPNVAHIGSLLARCLLTAIVGSLVTVNRGLKLLLGYDLILLVLTLIVGEWLQIVT